MLRSNLSVIIVGNCFVNLMFQIAWAFRSMYLLGLGIPGQGVGVGLVFNLYLAVHALAGINGAYLADFYGRYKVIVVGNFLVGLSGLLIAATLDWRIVVLGLIFRAAALFYAPAEITVIADSMPLGKRAFGFASFSTITAIAGLPGPIVGGVLFDWLGLEGLRWSWAVLGLLDMAKALFYLAFLKETLVKPSNEVEEEEKEAPLSWLRMLTLPYKKTFEALRLMPRALYALFFVMLLLAVVSSASEPFWQVYWLWVMGISGFTWGLIDFVGGVVWIVMNLPAGMLADRYEKRWAILFGLFLISLLAILFPFSRNAVEASLVFVGLSVGGAFFSPSFNALIADLTPKERRARLMVIPTILTGLGSFGSALGGILYSISPAYPFIFYGIVGMLAFVLAFLWLKEPTKEKVYA